MKIGSKYVALFAVGVIVVALSFPCNVMAKSSKGAMGMEAGFVSPPDSIHTSTYWYWISNNVTKEGVVKDLQSMKKAGINRAFIGNIGLDDVPYGKVKMLTEEWWEILHVALKTATELGIDIGIFNSPGWSQAGGPWVSEKEAMRYLTSSELRVKGPVSLNQKLTMPTSEFHDVKLIAYREPKNDLLILDTNNAKISSTPSVSGLEKLVDGDYKSSVGFPAAGDFVVDFSAKEDFTARSITYRTSENPQTVEVELQAKRDGNYKTIKKFVVERYNPGINIGFEPFASVVETFAAVKAKDFRVIIKRGATHLGIAEIIIGASPRIERYSEKTFAKMHQTPLPLWHEYMWEPQAKVDDQSMVIDPAKIIDISTFLTADGTLKWEVPAGDWVILRTGMTPTGTENAPAPPEATGYEVDKMSKKHVEMHVQSHMGEIQRRIPEADRKCFKVVVQDSYEMGGQNFTDDFLARFEKEYGYSAVPFLPTYSGKVVGSQDASDRFLWDMRRLVANMIAYDYVGGMRESCNKRGLTTWLENYGHWGFPGESLLYGSQSDEIGGEYWSEGTLGDIENRIATSCGHIYGKNKISAESYTSGGNAYGRTPASIKQRGDRFFAEGINNSLLHVYISQPDQRVPGINAGFSTEFNRGNTWFTQLDLFTAYLKRVNFMLQQGLNVADVVYFTGEDAPKMTGTTDPALPAGHQFDYINYDVIMNNMSVKDGLITLPHGTQYRMMVLPKLKTMRPELLAKIKELVINGAVIYGPAPERSPSYRDFPLADQQVNTMATEMWGELNGVSVQSRKYGKGMIIDGMEISKALKLIDCVADCNVGKDVPVHFGHRSSADAQIYYLTNQSASVQTFTPAFRVVGMQPELWEPTTGDRRVLRAFEQTAKQTIVPMTLQPNESVFVVFRKPAGKAVSTEIEGNYPVPTMLAQVKGPWTVKFEDTRRGPKEEVVFPILSDWSVNSDDAIKYYSGTAFYSSNFNVAKLPSKERVILNLTELSAMAKVKVNGVYVGGVWTFPYVLDITKAVKKGDNKIEVEVVNTWINRIVGDKQLPEAQRTTWTVHYPHLGLQKSGLIGPVLVQSVKY